MTGTICREPSRAGQDRKELPARRQFPSNVMTEG